MENYSDLARSLLDDDEGSSESLASPSFASSSLNVDELIRSKARDYGVPEEIAIALADTESSLNPDAQGPVIKSGMHTGDRAVGLFQLMGATASDLGVDRFDVEQNIDGGLRYLKSNYDRFGDWNLAVAAHQAGPGAVRKAGGIPRTSDGLSTTEQYVSKVMEKAARLGASAAPDADEPAEASTLDKISGLADKHITNSQNDGDWYTNTPKRFSASLADTIGGVAGWVNAVANDGGDGVLKGIQKWGKGEAERLNAELMKDPDVARANARLQAAEGFWGTLGAMGEDPEILADVITRSMAPFLLTLPVGGIGGLAGGALGASAAGARIATMAGVSTATAIRVGQIVGANLGASSGEGITTGGSAYNEIEAAMLKAGKSPEEARDAAIAGATQIGLVTAAMSTVGTGRAAAEIITPGLAKAGLKDAAKGATTRVGTSMLEEGGQEVAEDVIKANQLNQAGVASNPDLGKSFALGAAAGGVVGGAAGVKEVAAEALAPAVPELTDVQTQTPPAVDLSVRDIITPVGEGGAANLIERLSQAQSVEEATAIFTQGMTDLRVKPTGGVDLGSLSRVQAIQQVAQTEAMQAMLAQLSPEARQATLDALSTVTSGDPRMPNAARVQATDQLYSQLESTGTLSAAQAQLSKAKLEGTVEDKAAIQEASQILSSPAFTQFLANQPPNMKAALEASVAQINNQNAAESDRAAAASTLTKFAAKAGLVNEEAKAAPQQATEEKVDAAPQQLESNRAALAQVTSTPEWQAALKAMPAGERAVVLEQLSAVSNPKLPASYRNQVAAEVMTKAEAAGITMPTVTEQAIEAPQGATKGRVTESNPAALLATAPLRPEDGTITAVDPAAFQGEGMSSGEARFLQVVGRALGRNVVFFEQSGATAQRDGFVLPKDRNTIFLNRKQSGAASPMALLGHELFHSMPEDIKTQFIGAVSKVLPPENVAKLQQYINQPDLNQDGLMEEIGADLFGNGLNRPELIGKALDGMPVTAAQKLLQHVRQFIAKLINQLRGNQDFQTQEFILDLKSLDDAWVTAFREHVARVNAGQGMIGNRQAGELSMEELAELAADKESPHREQAEAEIARRSTYANPDVMDKLEVAAGISKPDKKIEGVDKKLALPKTKLQEEVARIREKKMTGQLLNARELALVDQPVDEKKIEIASDRQPKKEQVQKTVEAPISDEEAAAIEEELEAELNPDEFTDDDVNEDMPIRYSSKRAFKRERPEEMSTRVPTNKGGESAVDNFLVIGLKAMQDDQRAFEKNIGIVTEYPNYRDTKSADTPEKKALRFINHVRDNLLWLHDQMAPELRERAKKWYDGANKMTHRIAKAYDITDHQAAGVMAVLSPQKDWFQNVSLGERVISAMATKQQFKWSPQMDEVAARIYATERNKPVLDAIRGKRLSELTSFIEKAAWIRAYDQAHNSPHYDVVSPEGDAVGVATTNTGNQQRIAWGSLVEIAKAVSIYENGSPENISTNVGGQHKVRNFYNNILVPGSMNGHITIDTHAVAAGLLRPLSGSSTEVLHNFGTGGIAKAGSTGAKGTYGLYVEAYRRAAEARGVLPREMQSITWEAVRGLFKPAFKRNKDAIIGIDNVWKEFQKGKLTYEDARQQVLEQAGGIDAPSWDGSTYELDEEEGNPADTGELSGDSVSGGGAESIAARDAGQSGGVGTVAYSGERARILFEVAPDPHNTALNDRWRHSGIDPEVKTQISERIANQMIPKVLRTIGIKGEMRPQLGGYLGETNPSFSITLDDSVTGSQIARAAKLAGYVLSQDSMMVVSHESVEGADPVGIITVSLPEDADVDLVSGVYGQIYEIENGIIAGHTTVGGKMAMVDFSGRTQELAELIDQKLNGKYDVETHSGFASFIENKDYGYDSEAQSTGNTAATGASIRTAADRLRAEATSLLSGELDRLGIKYSAGRHERSAVDEVDTGQNRRTPRGSTSEEGYGQAREHSVRVEGVHFSRQQRPSLSSAAYGTGLKGAERDRIMQSKDMRLRSRIYFYVNEGKGVFPEQGVGSFSHRVTMNNLYDMTADPLGLNQKDKNLMESAVMDAGFDGYYAREVFGNQGVAVLLGRHDVFVHGTGTESAVAPAIKLVNARQLQQDILDDKRLPMGAMRSSRIEQLAPDLYKKLQSLGIIEQMGDRMMYRDEVARLVPMDVKKSVARGQIPQSWVIDGESSKMDDFIYTMQDKNVDMKRAVEAVKGAGRMIADQWDPYLQEELFHGRTAKQTKDFLDHEMKPLLQAMNAAKVEIADLNEYLHMRHAEERNVQIARINTKMPDGGSGVKTADARRYLAQLDPQKKRTLEALARRVDRITKETRDMLVASGLETQQTINEWENTYRKYVPLVREDVGPEGMGIGQGFSVKGSASKRAMGSDKPVADILAHVAMMRERTITRAEKNRVSLAAIGMAIQNPNPDFWFPVIPGQDLAKQQAALINMGINPVDANNLLNQPTKRYIDPRTGMVRTMADNTIGSMPNVIVTRFQGKDYYLVMNQQNEHAARMATSLKNLDADKLGRVMSEVAKVTRWFAAVNTQYNPIFGVLNVMRDTGSAMLNLSTTKIAGKQAEVSGNIAHALRGIYIALRDDRAGRTNRSQWARLWNEFQDEGGRTGYRDMFDTAGDRAKHLQSEIDALNAGKAKQLGRAVMGWLNDFNDTLENAVRLSAYKVGLENGMSKQQAASMAKNLTVNFNRKGTIATQAGALYAFFNASAQGSARLFQTLSGPAGKKILIGGAVLGLMQAIALAAAGIDDDVPEFVKQRNIVIPTGGGKYLSIPMPLGFNVIPGLTRMAAELAFRGGRDPLKTVGAAIDMFADNFNPIGNAGLSVQTIAPTFADPLVALAENKDWTGKPIAKEDRSSLNPTPGHTRAFATSSDIAKGISRAVNWATGGSEYKPGMVSPTPDQIDFLIGQITGGVGREALKVNEVISTTVTGEELPPNKVPLLGRFYGNASSEASTSTKFFENLTRLNVHEAELKGLKGEGKSTADYLAENPEAGLVKEANQIEKEITSLRKLKKKLIDSGAGADRVRAIDQRITSQMKRLNSRVESLE